MNTSETPSSVLPATRSQTQPSSRPGRSRFLFALWLCGVVAVAALSLLPATSRVVISCSRLPFGGDKGLHFAGYAGLSFLGALVFRQRANLTAAMAFLICLGLGLELGQRLSPGRSTDLVDFAANTAGVVAGWLLWGALRTLSYRPPTAAD